MIIILLFALTSLVGILSFLHIVYVIKISDHPRMNSEWFHVKIMEWVWNEHHTSWSNVCPYSWGMLLTMMILPLISLAMGFRDLWRKIILPYLEELDHRYNQWCADREEAYLQKLKENVGNKSWLDKMDDATIRHFDKIFGRTWAENGKDYKNIAENYYGYGGKADKYWKLFKEMTPEELERIKQLSADRLAKYHKRLEEDEEKKRQSQIQKNQHIAKLAKYGKYSLKGMGILVAGIITYLFVQFCIWTAVNVDWSLAIPILTKIIVFIIAAVIFISLCWKLYLFGNHLWCKYGKYCIPCEGRRNKMAKFFNTLGKYVAIPFVWIWDKIKLMVDILQAAADDTECPRADWE